MKIVLTKHAVERYQERIRPTLSLDAAREDLERLLPNAEIRGQAEDTAIIVIAPGIELVCHDDPRGRGYWVARTCRFDGLLHESRRRKRNERRSDRTRAKRHRSKA